MRLTRGTGTGTDTNYHAMVRHTAITWTVMVLSHFYAMRLDTTVPLLGGLSAWWLSWIPAGLTALALLGDMLLRRKWAASGLALTMMVSLGALVHWPGFYVWTFFVQNRPGFATVAELADTQRLDLDGYYGGKLPFGLWHLSVNTRAAKLPALEDETRAGVLLPQWIGFLDGAVGYAYLPVPPAKGELFDGFGDTVQACRSLGSGWYWVTRTGGVC
ncbi:MAG TPA: hypothetical protein VF062_21955 [Candidatus Limnocylindrales bacterium]